MPVILIRTDFENKYIHAGMEISTVIVGVFLWIQLDFLTLRLDTINQVLALFGAEMTPKCQESRLPMQKIYQLQSLVSRMIEIIGKE